MDENMLPPPTATATVLEVLFFSEDGTGMPRSSLEFPWSRMDNPRSRDSPLEKLILNMSKLQIPCEKMIGAGYQQFSS